MHEILVYGTLKKGFGNYKRLMGSAEFLREAKTVPAFTLISLGGFPGMLRGGTTSVSGEVFRVDDVTLAMLDRLEGHPHWYRREPVQLEDGTEVEAYIYLKTPSNARGIISDGVWR